jgi:hypothetical protein
MHTSFVTIISWFLYALVASGVAIMLYHLLLVFFMNNPRKKLICGIITAVMIGTSLFLFISHERQNVVQMEEDVLYVKPTPKIK